MHGVKSSRRLISPPLSLPPPQLTASRSGSFALERPLRIGYLGPAGSFSHEAAVKQFGQSVSYENLRTIDGVFEEVARGHVDYGLVPVENASIGSVAETLEGFMTHSGRVAVCAEVQLSVAQALICCPGAVPSDIRVVSSKPEALAQCRRWLSTQYPGATLVPAASTSAAVETLARAHAENGPAAKHMAAIGSKLAASLHDMSVLFPEVRGNESISRRDAFCWFKVTLLQGPIHHRFSNSKHLRTRSRYWPSAPQLRR